MATDKISVSLDEDLVRRVRHADPNPLRRSDTDVIERVLARYLGDRALEAARALGPLDPDEADRISLEEVRAARRARHQADVAQG